MSKTRCFDKDDNVVTRRPGGVQTSHVKHRSDDVSIKMTMKFFGQDNAPFTKHQGTC